MLVNPSNEHYTTAGPISSIHTSTMEKMPHLSQNAFYNTRSPQETNQPLQQNMHIRPHFQLQSQTMTQVRNYYHGRGETD